MADVTIDELALKIDYQAGESSKGLDNLKQTVEQLKGVLSGSTTGLTKLANGLKSVSESAVGLSSVNIGKFGENLGEMYKAVSSLNTGTIGKDLTKVFKQIGNIPEINKKLDTQTLNEFTGKIKTLSTALVPLAENLKGVGNVLNTLPSKLNKVSNYTTKANSSMSLMSKISGAINFGALIYFGKKAISTLSGFVENSSKYVEDLNLFNVSMGESTGKAKEWIDTVSQALGLDPAEMMRNMGTFNVMAEGFGLASDKAYLMSKNLTQLVYDTSSFFNIDFETSANKLRSAISGEVKPMRELGISLTQATLQQIAYDNGIEKSVATMSEAEKAQLRYIAIMTKLPQIQGDMSATINTAANSMRVLQQQFTLLGREIGNIFIPLLSKIIPIAIAVTKVLGKVARAIANLFGFTLPEIDWSSATSATSTVADDLDDATGSAKALKRQLAGFDELNNLTTPSAGGSGSANVVGPDFELPLPEYDMLEGLSKGIDDLTGQVMKFFGLTEDEAGNLSWSWKEMDTNAKILTGTIGLLAGVKVMGKLTTAFVTFNKIKKALLASDLGKYLTNILKGAIPLKDAMTTLVVPFLKLSAIISGLVVGVKGIKGITKAFEGLTKKTMSLEEATKKANKGVLALTAGGALIGSVFGPLGAIIGGMVGALAAGVVTQINYNKALKEFAKMQIYGDFELTQQQLEALGQKLTGTLNQEQQAVETYKKSLQNSASQLQTTTNEFDSLIFRFQTLGSELSGLTGEDIINSFRNTATEAYNIVGDTTDATIELFRKQFAEYSNLSAEEQAEIIKNIKTNGNTRQTRIKEIEDNVQRIYENAIAERGYLNEQEIEAIKKHYDEIVRLTSSNLERNGLELNRILSNVQNGMFALTEDGAKQLNETLSKANDEALTLIDENYQARLESAKTYAQTQYDNAILAGENEVEAQDRYNKALNLLEAEANNYKIEETNKLNAKYSTIMNSFYGQAIRDYKENYIGKTEKELGDHGVAVKKAYEKMLTDAGFNLAEIARTSTTQSILATNNWNNNFKPNTSISSIALDTNGITRSGINAGNIWSSGFNSVVSGLSINTKVNSGYTSFGDAVQFQLKMGGFASGGFPDTGEFFMARENGIPEMVGKIGNRTAVANNTQIVEAIEQGVYRGTASANESASATPIYNVVNIGNRKVYSGVAQNVRTENNRYGVAVLEV